MNEFKSKIKKVSKSRTHSITNSYGIKDSFIYYKKTRPKDKEFVLSDSDYRKLIRRVNEEIVKEFINHGEFKLPLDMGNLRIYKKENKPKIIDGKLVYNAPIDWNKTLELWSEYNESKVAKTLVKVAPGDIYSIKYKHSYCKFLNKEYYMFKPNRQMKLLLKDSIDKKDNIPYFNHKKKI